MLLTSREYRALLEIIEIIYEIPDEGAMFAAVSQKLQSRLGICSSAFIPFSKTHKFRSEGYHLFGLTEAPMTAYLSHFVALDPLVHHEWPQKSLNTGATYTDYVSRRELLDSEFGHDFLLGTAGIFYNIGATLVSQGHPIGIVAFHRRLKQEDFNSRDREFFNFIFPHMAHAIRNRQINFSGEQSGVVAMDERGR